MVADSLSQSGFSIEALQRCACNMTTAHNKTETLHPTPNNAPGGQSTSSFFSWSPIWLREFCVSCEVECVLYVEGGRWSTWATYEA